MVTAGSGADQPKKTRVIYHDPQQIIRRRVCARLDQQSLALRAGIAKSFMWRIEHGKCRPSPQVLGQIADALGCEVEDLMLAEPVALAS